MSLGQIASNAYLNLNISQQYNPNKDNTDFSLIEQEEVHLFLIKTSMEVPHT